MAFLDHLFAVIPLLGILIFVHELGHFLAAKAFGVRVLKFSLGFGSPIGFGKFRMRWERSGTEYVVAWFPLGGFVRMLGGHMPGDEADEEEVVDARPDEYMDSKPVWQKLVISFAGPAMNLVLPVIGFVLIYWVGAPRPVAVVGMVEDGSPAALVDIHSGDEILRVNGEPVVWWNEVDSAVRENMGDEISLDLLRDQRELSVSIPIEERSELDGFGEIQDVGWIGLGHPRVPALIGIGDADGPATRAGLRSSDAILAVDGEEVETWLDLARVYAGVSSSHAEFRVQRGEAEEPIELRVPALGSLDALGVVAATVLVSEVNPDLPAFKAGLRPGDLILEVDGEPIGSFSSFQRTVFSGEGRTMQIGYSRAGELVTVPISPLKTTVPHPLGIEGMDETVYRIGITHQPSLLAGVTRVDRVRNPLVSVPRAVENTLEMIALFLKGLGKLIVGDLGMDQLSGPIGIAEIARKTLDLGWYSYLQTMMFISINLGILNLLPIPVLDGGQIVLITIEGVRRSPVSHRTREIVQSVGLTLLLMLMGRAFWNDLSRHWNSFIEWVGAAGL